MKKNLIACFAVVLAIAASSFTTVKFVNMNFYLAGVYTATTDTNISPEDRRDALELAQSGYDFNLSQPDGSWILYEEGFASGSTPGEDPADAQIFRKQN